MGRAQEDASSGAQPEGCQSCVSLSCCPDWETWGRCPPIEQEAPLELCLKYPPWMCGRGPPWPPHLRVSSSPYCTPWCTNSARRFDMTTRPVTLLHRNVSEKQTVVDCRQKTTETLGGRCCADSEHRGPQWQTKFMHQKNVGTKVGFNLCGEIGVQRPEGKGAIMPFMGVEKPPKICNVKEWCQLSLAPSASAAA